MHCTTISAICMSFYTYFSLDKTVLVIGGGPSGIDLAHALSTSAIKVIFSHHTHHVDNVFATNVIKRGSIDRFTRHGVVFTDGSEETITDILFCTGNERSFSRGSNRFVVAWPFIFNCLYVFRLNRFQYKYSICEC